MGRTREPIEWMRSSYELGRLDEADLAVTWIDQLQRWLDDAIAAGLPEPHAMVLTTVGTGDAVASGATPARPAPSARTVLLRGLDAAGLRFHTNYESRKGRELDACPRAALLFPWYAMQRQAIVEGTVERLPAADSDAYYDARPPRSRIAAAASPQSQPIDSRDWLERRFAALEAEHPDDGAPPRPAHWGGYLVVPHAVELWQGRRDRLHDRLRYRRDAAGEWAVERLAP